MLVPIRNQFGGTSLSCSHSARRTDSPARAAITSPSADSDLLMACASFSCSPALPLFFTLQQHHRTRVCWHDNHDLLPVDSWHASDQAAAQRHRWKCISEGSPFRAGKVHEAELAASDVLCLQIRGRHDNRHDQVAAAGLSVHLHTTRRSQYQSKQFHHESVSSIACIRADVQPSLCSHCMPAYAPGWPPHGGSSAQPR